MTTSIIESPYNVGDVLYVADGRIDSHVEGAITSSLEEYFARADLVMPKIVAIAKVKVVSVARYRINPTPGRPAVNLALIKSFGTAVYKVVRHTGFLTGSVGLLREDAEEFVRVQWPESKPFHDAFGEIDSEGGTRQVIYVRAIEVDGHYKLEEILDDQDW